ncbi:MAG: NADH-quinone oxidoreductase subunit I [Chloroflexi bacterium]|nr:NADH-quinone oxidoreductase subunit I [Chloroflexota bacterium]
MARFLEGLVVTLKTALRKPVTAQYPDPDKRIRPAERFMGFPALLWDYDVNEPYCTGCMVCVRNCPTQCMSAEMKDNPKFDSGESRRRKIIEEFEINLGRCILCGICVDVCNFDAIEMSHEHELSKYERNGNRADLARLLEMGKEYQAETNWKPANPEKNSGVPRQAPARAAAAESAPTPSRDSSTEAKPSSEMTKEERLAAARARAQAKRQAATPEATAPFADGKSATATSSANLPEMTKEERLAAARARVQAKRQAASSESGMASTDGAEPKQKGEMTEEERVAAARARARAKREAAQSDSQNEDKSGGT